MTSNSLKLLAAGVCLVAGAGAPLVAADEEAEYGVLVDKPGVEITYAYCSACHSELLVAQQGLSRTRWEHLLEWMVEEQGMPELDDDELNEILDYLAENYGEDRPNFPGKG
jgi:cytochrome c